MAKDIWVPNPVNQLMRDAITGKSSRRDLIRRGSALGLSGALMAPILKAASVGAQATPEGSPAADQPIGWSLQKPSFLEGVDYSGQEITVVLDSEGPGTPFEVAMIDRFMEWTGATVNRIPGQESATDRLSVYQQNFNAQSSDIDVFQIDVIWPGILAMHAEDLTEQAELLGEQGYTWFQDILDNNKVDGVQVSLPLFTDAGLLYYRTDLLEKYGYDAAPTTWTELEEMAQAIQDGEVGEGNSAFAGFTFQAAAYEGLTCNGLEWMYSQGGGEIVTTDGEVTVGRDEAKAAIERARGWVGTFAPEAVTGYMEEDSRGVWQGGNSAFHRNWPYVYAISAGDDSELQGKFDITLLPKGDEEDAVSAATLGGWNLMVSKYSEKKDVAKMFASWITSYEAQYSRALERSQNATILEVYEQDDVIAANPFMETLKDTFLEGTVARPSNVAADLYNDVSVAYFTKVNEILTGQHDDVGSAMDDLAAELEDIMSEV